MKIQRFKVLRENFLEERDFSNSPKENLLTFSEEVLLNIMKVIEMYHDFNDGQYTKHWIKKIANNLILIQRERLTACSFYLLIDLNTPNSFLGQNIVNDLKDKYGRTEVDVIKNYISEYFLSVGSNLESGQEAKYSHLYTGTRLKEFKERLKNEYPLYYKYIALCLSGQIEPSESVWENYDFIIDSKINYNSVIKFSSVKEIEENILFPCFYSICGSNSFIK